MPVLWFECDLCGDRGGRRFFGGSCRDCSAALCIECKMQVHMRLLSEASMPSACSSFSLCTPTTTTNKTACLPGRKGKQCDMLQSMVTMLCKIPVTGWILRSNHRKGWILCGNHRRSRRSPHPLCGSCWSILTPGGALLVHLGARSASDTLISGDVCRYAQLHNTQQQHIQLGDRRNIAEFRFDIGKDVYGKAPLLPKTFWDAKSRQLAQPSWVMF